MQANNSNPLNQESTHNNLMKTQTSNRKEQILNWLKTSQARRDHKTGGGFFISKGNHVSLKDGSVCDLLTWLLDEGFCDGDIVGRYSVAHQKEGDFSGRLTFFEILAEEAPFYPSNFQGRKNKEGVEESTKNNKNSFQNISEDDIPF